VSLKRILIATDAWKPQVNGVVRTLETTRAYLEKMGHTLEVIEQGQFPNRPVPFYPEIRLAFFTQSQLVHRVKKFNPDCIHIATEGPIGLAVRWFCRRNRLRFTTSYHTKFPEYLEELIHLPASFTYRFMRRFHSKATRTFVATPSLEAELRQRGFQEPIVRWSRGVDLSVFHSYPKRELSDPRPIHLYAGRVSKEKNLEAFLKLQLPGTKWIVGDGPHRETLQKQYPDAKFLGYRRGQELAQTYSDADLFVFPSKTDTFGLVMIEAMACGLPVAAYPVVGPVDIVTEPKLGALRENLGEAIEEARQTGDKRRCIEYAQQFTWERCTLQFLHGLVQAKT
jgi:glycosyltransferase involved in cell wall biosynthesis